MSDVQAVVSSLSPERRALLALRNPLSFAQQRLWFLEQLGAAGAAYHLAFALRLAGRLDVPALQRSLDEVVSRHEALRATFVAPDAEPIQIFNKRLAVPLRLATLDGAEREAGVAEWLAAEAAEPFDLARGALRAGLLRLADDEHVLAVTMHHIVSDGWSLNIFIREMAALYAAFSRGLPSPLPPVPAQYGGFVRWQRERLQGERLAAELGYWRERLAGAPPVLELPTDRPRPRRQTFRGASHRVSLGAELTGEVREFSRHAGTTVFVTVLAAFTALASRLAGQDDVVLGTPVANRVRAELEGVVGMFINTLVLRTRVSPEASFLDLLQEVRTTVQEAQEHQEVPFEKIVEELQPERRLSHAPVFQVLVADLVSAPETVSLPELTIAPLETTAGTARFDLGLSFLETGGSLAATFEYNVDLFDAATIARMGERFRALLAAAVRDPALRVFELPLLVDEERRALLAPPAETGAPDAATVCGVVEEHAARDGGRRAVAFGESELSYQEVNRRANQVAHGLRRLGVAPGDRVGLYTERSLELLPALLGIMKAGAAYVPLDPEHPRERTAYVLDDCAPALVLAQAHLAPAVPATCPVVAVDAGAFDGEPETDPAPVEPEQVAYVIYTSGSTGRPKGVQVSHGALWNLLASMAREPGVTADDTLVAVTTVTFDISLLELLLPLAVGARVVIAAGGVAADGERLAELLRREGATVMQATPSGWRVLVESGWAGSPSLRMLCGGEALPPGLAAELLPRGAGLWNVYGPTETTIWSSVHRVEAGSGSIPLGHPVARTEIQVLDAYGAPRPFGAPGEVHIGGAGLAAGYFGRPDLTAERFVPHPFAARGGERLYRTGDLARRLADGSLEFLGRVDNQVKVRGFRIELGEIEAVLQEHPLVREAAVVLRDGAQGEWLAAYVAGTDASGRELLAYLRERLPAYMVPATCAVLDALPRTSSGKVDRARLPAADGWAAALEYVAPRTPVEEAVATAWGEALGHERVSAHANFFELGGHSLLATRVMHRLRREMGVELPLHALFEQPTLAGLAARVEALLREGGAGEAPPLVPIARDGALPLSFAQQRLWFIQQMEPESTAYNMLFALRLTGALDVAALERSLAEVVRRHEVLRTRFASVDGEAVQVIGPAGRDQIEIVDLAHLPPAERLDAARALATAESARPFDLAAGPLLRFTLVRLADEEHALVFALHHVVFDGWSTGVLTREVSALYAAFAEGREPSLPELPIQYADFAAWQRGWLRGEVLDAQVAYWRERLAGAPPLLELPTDRPRPQVAGGRGAVVPFALSGEATDALRALSRREGATLFMTLMAGWQLLLSRYSGQEDVSVGSPIAGRTREETEELIGFFVNTLVLRTDLSGAPTFREVIGRVREATLGAYQHQDVPFEKLVEELAPERSLSHTPLFQAMFILQNNAREALRLGSVEAEPLGGGEPGAQFDVTLSVEETEDGLAGGLTYRAELFDRGTVERMVEHLGVLLEEMAADPERRTDSVELLRGTERARVLDEWNATGAEYPAGACIHHLIEARAARTPDASAVVFGGETVTYGELDARANRLAHHLAELGAGPEVRVGISLERSAEMVVAMLAVLKSGSAYVPLDPSYPAERVAWMLEDSRASLLVTQARLLDRFAGAGTRTVCVDGDAAAIAAQPPQAPQVRVDARNAAYVLYTSGSTGRPKGVVVPHAAVSAFFTGMDERVGGTVPGTWLAVTRISFDIHVLELLWTLARGFRVVVQPEAEQAAEDETLVRQIRRHAVTHLQCTPSLAAMLIAEGGVEALSGLERLLLGGEALPADLAAQVTATLPGRLVNLYGPTETTVWSATHAVEAGQGIVPIGRPIANTRVYVLDAALRPQPAGVPGELYIGGAGVTRGYLRRPALTAERFIPDAFSDAGGARLYRTGDRVRWLHDGTLEYLGRLDEQVKIRGFRIEPGEIESVLRRCEGVRECAVVVREHAPGDRRLAAYVVGGADAEALRAELRRTLPDYMVPSAFVVLDALPLTPNGKLDRRALPAPEAGADEAAYVAPRTQTEEVVAGIFAGVLQAERVGVRDGFFELGGHSLLATRVVSRIREAFGVELPLRALFEAPTVAELAREIARRRAEPGAAVAMLSPIVPDADGRHEPFPLTDVQQAYWVGRSGSMELGNVATHGYTEFDLQDVDIDRLERAMRGIVERHEMLRAIVLPDGRQQILAEVPPYRIDTTDLRGADGAEREAHLARVRAEMSHEVLPADRWPLFGVRASILSDERVRIHFSLDYLIADAWSNRIIFDELAERYADPDLRLPPLELSFRDCVLAAYAEEGSDAFRRAEEYWRDRLADLPPAPELPLAMSPDQLEQPRFVRRTATLDAARWEWLRARAARAGLTPSGVLLAAFAEVLAAWSKNPRLTINLTLFNRPPAHPEIDEVVGDFTALSLLGVDAPRGDGFEVRARRIQEQLWSDMEHGAVSGVRVLRDLARMQGRPAASIMPVVFTSTLGQRRGGGGGILAAAPAPLDGGSPVYSITQTPQVWLDHQVGEHDGGLVFNWDAVEDLFSPGVLDAMWDSYRELLGRLATSEEAWQDRVGARIPPAQLARRARVNATEAPVPAGLLHEGFEEHARRAGDRLAVVAGERRMTYAELEHRSRALGLELRARGALPNRLVAVVMDKGWEQVVAVMGIVRSGAAYLPIDAGLPPERITQLLEAGEVELAVVQPEVEERLEWPAGIQRIRVEAAEPELDAAAELPAVQGPDDLAYVIFTSGSTGVPKGVMIDHRGALNTVVDVNERYAVGPEDRVLGLSALNFDLSVYDIFGLLAAGGALVLPDAGASRDPETWAQLVSAERVTVWNSVPALMEMMAHYAADREDGRLESLRVVMLSGDWLPVTLPDRVRALCPRAQVHSLGGATEASIWSITYPVAGVRPEWTSIPYGVPMVNQTFHVLDERLAPRPEWVPGQLYIGGVGLAKGYWRDAEKTAASFITHPQTGERLYRTGDLGRYLADGSIEFLGREDFQVKVQGHRIELGEIESVLEQHPEVRGAVAAAVGERNQRRLVAFVVAAQDAEPSPAGLRDFLAARLPAYMVPASITPLEAFPLSLNGKVDRTALAELAQPEGPAPERVARARTPLEDRIAAVWSEVLRVDDVGADDNLYALGGNSILAVRIVNRIGDVLGVQVPLRQLFQAPTVEGMAAIVRRLKEEKARDSEESLREHAITPDLANRHEPFPLNDVQHAYWMGRTGLFQLGNVSAHSYNEYDARGLDLPRLEAALRRVIDRHDMLRAVLTPEEQQRVLPEVPPYRIEVLDLRGLPAAEAEAAREALRHRMSHQVLPADRWPLFEIAASVVDGESVRLHVSMDILFVDAWSGRILWRDLAAFYQDPDLAMPPLELAFRDYVLAEARFRESPQYQRARDYWWERAATLPPAPDLPFAVDPGSIQQPRFVRRTATLPREQWERLRTRAAAAGLTPSGVLLAAYAETLAGWSRSSRFTINLTLFNRLPLHPQVNEVVGDHTTLNLLTVDTARGDSFQVRAQALQEQLWEDLEHRFVGGVEVVREMARLQGRSPAAVTPVVFTSNLFGDAFGVAADDASDLEMEQVFGVSQTPQVWLDHQVGERDGGLVFNWDAVEELFSPGVLDGMWDSYRELLERLVGSDEAWQDGVAAQVPAAQLERRARVNATEAPVPAGLLHEGFEEHARRAGDRLAVVAGDRRMTYAELERRSRALGLELRARGALPNRLVAVVMDKGWEQVVAVLGIVRSGAAYLPIDAALPPERIAQLLEAGEVELAVVQPEVEERLAWPDGIQRIRVEAAEPELDAAAELPAVQGPEDLAYVIFTSGSTGVPKGVMIDHRGALNTCVDVNERYAVGPEDRVLGLSALNFDLSVYDVFGLLAAGGALVLPDAGASRDPETWAQLVSAERVTIWNSVPALMEMMAHYAADREDGRLESLRVVMLSGDWLPVTLPDRIRTLCPRAQVHSLGGATEASIWSITYPVEQVRPEWTSIPYGVPMVNQTFHVLDDRLAPRPEWVPGQLHIGGVGLAKGYWRDAEKTAASFITHPQTGERLYRTGDLGRYLADGNIEFLGREDFQVKVQGHRIELGEIESVLEQHPGVRGAVAAAVGERTERRLVAFVVAAQDAEPSPGELRDFLASRLPAYMVPASITPLEAFPLSLNGKVDRTALAELAQPEGPAPERVARARTPLEDRIAAVWSEVLRVDDVGADDNLYALGGNSILAVRIVNRIGDVLGVQVPLRQLFQAPTVEGMAAVVRRLKEEKVRDSEESLREHAITPDLEHRHEPFPLNDVQHAYWMGRTGLFQLGNVAAHAYNEYDVRGLELERLEAALGRVIERHDMLRAVLTPEGQQRVLPEVPPYRIEVLDLRGLPAAEAEAAREALRHRMSHQVLPAERWPLFEIATTVVDGESVRLHVSMDILFVDAWSVRILWRDLARFYQDPELALPPLELAFRDYVLAETRFRESPQYQRARDYWWERAATLPAAPDLPFAVDPGSIQQPRFVRRTATLPREQWERLRTRAAAAGLTPSGVLLAAYAETLAGWSRSSRFTINLTLFNRLPLHPQVNEVMGDHTTLNLLTVDTSRGDSFQVRAQALQEQLWEDLEHRFVGGVEVVREMARRQQRSPAAVTPVVFTSNLFGDAFGTAAEGGGADLEMEQVFGISQTPQVWLDHQVGEREGGLVFNWDSVEELFSPGVLDAMWDGYRELLERLAGSDEAWLDGVAAQVPAAQLARRALVNATEAPVPAGLLHEGFEEHARRAGDRLAVVAGERRLTYAELERRSRALGLELRARGALPNRLVAVVMDKGWEQVVAVLGIVRSGAAYLPIDAALPPERIAQLLEAGEVELAVVQPEVEERLAWPDGIQRIRVEAAEPELDAAAELPAVQGPEDLAYVIFTSGSTGVPKGVMIDHRGALNTCVDVNERYAVGPEDRVLGLSALNFDLSVYDIFGLLAAGGALVLPDAGASRDPETWAQLVSAERVTVWNSVPALMEMMAHYAADREDGRLESLRVVMLSGDWLPVTLPDRIRALCPRAQVHSLGGATEASIWSITYPVGQVRPEWTSIPYGVPMVNQTFHVLDERFAPRPEWVPGQLYIGGVGLAKGYWRDAEKTAASFITHPQTGERLYRTGDLGRYLADGNIEFLGREDFQVKVQGHRIELGEIESVLEQHPDVRGAVAAAVGERDARRLVAYVTPHESTAGPRHGEEAARLARTLAALRQVRAPELPLPKYGYPSAGNLYPVQAYVAVPDSVEGIEAGTYYHDPRGPRLVRVAPPLPGDLQGDGPAVFLVARLEAIAPVYGSLAPDFCLLEAGYVQVLLADSAARQGLAAAPAPIASPARLREHLGLDEGHVPLQCIRLAPAGAQAAAGGGLGRTAWEEMSALVAGHLSSGASLGKVELLEHKLREPGLRPARPGEATVELGAAPDAADLMYRSSDREFLADPVPLETFREFLATLAAALPASLAGMPGDALAVALHLAPGAVEGLAPGGYRYHPGDARLSPVAPGAAIPAEAHAEVNRAVFQGSAFSVFLCAEPGAPGGRDAALLLAGGLGQALMAAGPAMGIGLCPIGSLEFGRVRPALGVPDGAELLHSFVGGRIPPRALPETPAPAAGQAEGAAAPGTAELAESVRRFLASRLPDYMVPRRVVVLDELPLSSNGKVDRKALPQVDDMDATVWTAARTPAEERLSEVWRELLGVERVGVDDSFFMLGGDSVKAIQFLSRAREAGFEIEVRDFFRDPRISALARLLAPREAGGGEAATAAFTPVVSDDELTQEELEQLLAEFGDFSEEPAA